MGSNSDDPAEKPRASRVVGAAVRDRQIRSHHRAVECVRGRGRLHGRSRSDGIAPNNAPMRDVSWDDAQQLCEMAEQVTASRTACPPKPNGNTRRAAARRRAYWWGDQMQQGQRRLQGLRRAVTSGRTGRRRLVRRQSVWALRHERQRLGMGRRLLAQLVQGRARRRPRVGRARLPRAGDTGRVVARRRGYMQSRDALQIQRERARNRRTAFAWRGIEVMRGLALATVSAKSSGVIALRLACVICTKSTAIAVAPILARELRRGACPTARR